MSSEAPVIDPRDELRELVAGLRAHLERLGATGVRGLPAAGEALARARRGPPEPTTAASTTPTPPGEPARVPTPGSARAAPGAAQGGAGSQVEVVPGGAGAAPAVAAPAVAAPAVAAPAVAAPAVAAPAVAAPAVAAPAVAAPAVAAVGASPAPAGAEPRSAARVELRPGGALPVVAGDATARSEALDALAARVGECRACGLAATRRQTVFARGTGRSGLCFVGEGPGADEDEQGLPFVGAAGQLLDKMIAGMGIARDEVYVCNIVKCRPPDNRTPTPEEMGACRGHLAAQLTLVQPQVIVALGATAARGLLGTTEGITRLRGRWKLYQGIAVMPTFHPAYILRNAEARRPVWEDLKLVLRQLGRPVPGEPR